MSSNEKTVSGATIAISAGVSAVVSALIVTIGVIGTILIDDGDRSPTVVTALPAQVVAAAPAAASGGTAAAAAPAAAPGAAAVPAAAVPAAPAAAPTTAQVPVAAPQDVASSGTPPEIAPVAAAPSALSEGELIGKLQLLLGGAGQDAKAAEAEGGYAALPTVDAVGGALNAAGAVYKWTVDGPVTTDSDVMTAQLRTSLIGFPDRSQPISWRWIDGSWKLTNESVCALAANAMATCTV